MSDPFLNYLALFLLLLVCAVVFYAVIDLFRFVKKIWTGRRAQSKS
jgi:cytochrome b